MRVISGLVRGCKLCAPQGISTRPTADRIKESVFNIIAPDLDGSVFLDLFAGSGAIGIEALSRGALKSFFVDNNSNAVKIINSNLTKTKLTEKGVVFCMEAEAALKLLSEKGESFDIIFMDPPYKNARCMADITGIIGKHGLLAPEGYIIGECGQDVDINSFGDIDLLRVKKYSKTTAVFFWRPSNGDHANDKGNFSGYL